MTIRDPLYIQRPKAQARPQLTTGVNLQQNTLAPAAATVYFLNDTYVSVVARRVQQPDQPNGMIQRLTFTAPTMPFNKFDWPNPLPRKPVPQLWNSSQGQNPAMIAAAVVTSGYGQGSLVAMGRMMTRG